MIILSKRYANSNFNSVYKCLRAEDGADLKKKEEKQDPNLRELVHPVLFLNIVISFFPETSNDAQNPQKDYELLVRLCLTHRWILCMYCTVRARVRAGASRRPPRSLLAIQWP